MNIIISFYNLLCNKYVEFQIAHSDLFHNLILTFIVNNNLTLYTIIYKCIIFNLVVCVNYRIG